MKKVPRLKAGGFGEYLVLSGVITQEQYARVKTVQNINRLMGIIAKGEKYLNDNQVEKVVEYMLDYPTVKFGEAAIALGLIDPSQHRHLMHLCLARKTRIGEILLNLGLLDQKRLNDALVDFHLIRQKSKRVLVVEPAANVSMMLELTLKKYGYEIERVPDGDSAIAAVASFKPTLILCSAALDGPMSGYEICSEIKNNPDTKSIPIIIFAATVTKEAIDKAFEAGAAHVLKLSCKESELLDAVMQAEGTESRKRTERILVADDSPLARMVVLNELSPIWGDIHLAENGEQAVKMAKELQPDIITMDVEMPVMNGLDACRNIRNDPTTENIPVIFITANNTLEFREEGFAAGAVEYFAKPFKAGHLAIFIKTLFEMKNARKDGKILIVENSPSERHIFSYFLQKNGYAVFGARNGEESLKAVNSFKPDLVITDSHLPGMNAFELTKRLAEEEKSRSTPVIMVTSSKEKGEAIQGLAAGAVDYIVKPFDESEMIARLQVHIRNKRLLEQIVAEKEKLGDALSKLEDANKILERLAVGDGLTGLSNRRHFDELIRVEWSRAWRDEKPLSFLMLDIDFFKKYNDGYGHQQGDTCIKKVAGAIKQIAKRPTDIAARYGGEEFAIILPGTVANGAFLVAEGIRALVEAWQIPHEYSGVAPYVTVSIGYVCLDPTEPNQPKEFKELIEMADKALYKSKHDGRNRASQADEYAASLATVE
ncbi:MAG: response regulator [Nitrospinae bacterium]|nr:response regulator [Nitrospinota bacterium]